MCVCVFILIYACKYINTLKNATDVANTLTLFFPFFIEKQIERERERRKIESFFLSLILVVSSTNFYFPLSLSLLFSLYSFCFFYLLQSKLILKFIIWILLHCNCMHVHHLYVKTPSYIWIYIYTHIYGFVFEILDNAGWTAHI